MDLDHAAEYYAALEQLLHEVRIGLEKNITRHLSDYVQESLWEMTVVIPTVRGKMVDDHCFPINSKFALYPENSADRFPFSYWPAVLPEEKRRELGMQKWNLPEVRRTEEFRKSLAEIYILSSQLAEFAHSPVDSTNEHAIGILQDHFKEKATQVGESLESLIESSRHLLKRFGSKHRSGKSHDVSTLDCDVLTADMIKALREILDAVFPEQQTVFVLSLERMSEYAKRLSDALMTGLALRLHWIDNILAEFEKKEV